MATTEAEDRFDLAIVGGGINGAGIARDAAGRDLRVVLIEQHDLASHTSSASTKLIHGGLRYLEQGELRLVREALSPTVFPESPKTTTATSESFAAWTALSISACSSFVKGSGRTSVSGQCALVISQPLA